MEYFNIENLEHQVNCQYTDMKGVIAIDFRLSIEDLYVFLKKKGEPMDDKLIIGIGLFTNPYKNDKNANLEVYYLNIVKGKTQADYEETKETPKKLRVEIPFIDLFDIINRLNVKLITNLPADFDFENIPEPETPVE